VTGNGAGLVDPAWWRDRQDDYLRAATTRWAPHSPLNLIDHLEWAARDPGHRPPLAELTPAVVDRWCRRIDHWEDCADFDVLRLLTLWLGYRDALPDGVAAGMERRFLAFTYWYDDPHPPGVLDERWYWSENHRVIFHACEYLAGQAFGDRRFAVTGLRGREHLRRAEARLLAWFDEKARLGFSEWHSDVYYEKDLAPLVTLAEFADDPALAERAATFADLVLLDLALHHHRGNVGCTHGRSYMKDKSRAADQPVFAVVKLCFDATDEPWPLESGDDRDLLPRNEGATLLARARRYRPPEVVRRIAVSTEEFVDREHMGLALDPGEALTDRPTRDDGLRYDDPDLVPFWWDRGCLTPWQLVPLTIATLDRHHLWEAWLFRAFRTVREAFGDDPETWRRLSHDLQAMVNAGVLLEVETHTWRSAHGMLSTAQSYRAGCAGFQHHVWQATLDERAVVFTVHPGNEPTAHAGDWLDDDRYWTGSATLPRSVQHRHVAIHLYAPQFPDPGPDGPLAGFHYRPYTHAYVPTEYFDEVDGDGHWTVARRRSGLVALWSWRPVRWRHHDPATTFTNGLRGPFDLVADGGPDNVWVVEMGDTERWGDLAGFLAALRRRPVEVRDLGSWGDGTHRGFEVTYHSPTLGELRWSWDGPLMVEGAEVPIDAAPRFDNPFCRVERGATTVEVTAGDASFTLDLADGRRGPRRPGHPTASSSSDCSS
jgi:hypothetical protein